MAGNSQRNDDTDEIVTVSQTYKVTYIVVTEAEDADDAEEQAREIISNPDCMASHIEPVDVFGLTARDKRT